MRQIFTSAFAASVVAAATLLAIASPAQARPSLEGGAVHTKTLTFTAHAASVGKITTLSNPLDITCTLTTTVPVPQGSTLMDSFIFASAATVCRFDINGAPATVTLIDMTERLLSDTAVVKVAHAMPPGDDRADTIMASPPCRHGSFTNSAQVTVTFPAGYVPQTASGSTSSQTFFGLGDCPGDKVEVPDVSGESVSRASSNLQAAGLVAGGVGTTVSCDVPRNTIAFTEPPAGALVLLGTIVTMRKSVGPPATPCP